MGWTAEREIQFLVTAAVRYLFIEQMLLKKNTIITQFKGTVDLGPVYTKLAFLLGLHFF